MESAKVCFAMAIASNAARHSSSSRWRPQRTIFSIFRCVLVMIFEGVTVAAAGRSRERIRRANNGFSFRIVQEHSKVHRRGFPETRRPMPWLLGWNCSAASAAPGACGAFQRDLSCGRPSFARRAVANGSQRPDGDGAWLELAGATRADIYEIHPGIFKPGEGMIRRGWSCRSRREQITDQRGLQRVTSSDGIAR